MFAIARRESWRLGRAVAGAILLVAAATSARCDSANGPACLATDPACAFSQTLQGTSSATEAPSQASLTTQTLTSDRRGIATVTLSWANASTDLDFFATLPTCTTSPFDAACGPPANVNIAFSQASTGTTEVLTFGMTKGQTMTLWIQQVSGPASVPYSIAVTIQ